MTGFVYLVGAGPGDPELLTVRAAELLRSAEVVAHDELVSKEILALAPAGAERIAVGRRAGHGPTSHRLHPDVLARAQAGRRVVRLKGGDPLVFGRGGEEAEALAAEGIGFELVPGISAALGAAASSGIPLTHRDCASSVRFAAGYTAAAPHGETLVLYMAGQRVAESASRLIADGRSPMTPAALVASATRPEQRVVTGTLADLAAKVDDAVIDPAAPALLIIGDVVARRVGPSHPLILSGGRAPASPQSKDVERHAPRPSTPGSVLRTEPSAQDERKGREPPAQDERKRRRGLLIVYTGHGKGKTTAALGLVFRAMGRGLRVAVVQFIKGKWKTGERTFAETLPDLTFLVMGKGFTWESDDLSRDRAAARAAWAAAAELIAGGAHALVVLDELTYAIHYGFVDGAEVVAALRARPAHVHVVVTGRNAPDELLAAADLVSEMRAVRHPFEQGVPAQPGIDF